MMLDSVTSRMGLDKPPKRSVKTATTVFGIIEYLLETGGATVAEIAESQGMARSTVHSHLATLSTLEYVVRKDGTYQLSLKFLKHGILVRDDLQLTEVAPPIIAELSAKTGEVSWILVEEHGKAVYLARATGDQAIEDIEPVARAEDLRTARETADRVEASDAVQDYVTRLADYTREYARLGASPRGSIALVRAAQGRALLESRSYLIPDDVQAAAPVVFPHRMRTDPGADDAEAVVDRALESVPVDE